MGISHPFPAQVDGDKELRDNRLARAVVHLRTAGWKTHGADAKHVDRAFLRSLGPVEVEETLGELGADSKLVRRRIAFELGLAAE